jgi:PAS domain S-box-containing protein
VTVATDVARTNEPDDPSARTQRLARLYLVLSRTNQAIEHATTDVALLGAACQTIIEVGGFLMSWVGKIDTRTKEVAPVASFGYDEGYLDFVQVRIEGTRSEGPTGQAIRLGRPVVCDDIATDPRMAPWRDEALRRGYRSSVGLPLYRGGALFGVLTVYADWPSRFDAGELELLQELARDVSFGLTTLEEAAERRRAQDALTASEQRFVATAETLLDPFVIMAAIRDDAGRIVDFRYEFANAAACEYNHLTREELIGNTLLTLLPAHESAGLIELYGRTVETGQPLVLDDLGYEDSWGDVHAARVFDIRATKLGDAIAYTWRDVTERRHAERRRAEDLEQRVAERTSELELAQRRAAELAGLSSAMLEIDDAADIAHKLLDVVSRISGAVDGLVALVAPETQRLDIVGSIGFEGVDLDRVANSPAAVRTPIRDVALTGLSVVLEDAEAYRKRYGDFTSMIDALRNRARVAFPLCARDRVIGGVALGFEPRRFDQAELDFFESLATAAALALERLRLTAAEHEARGMLDAVIAQMPVGVAVAGRDGRIRYRNGAFDRVFQGAAVENLADGSWLTLHIDDRPYAACELPAARSLATGEVVVNEEMKVVGAGGGTAVILQTSAPFLDVSGEIAGAVVVSVDVTDRKEADQLRDAFVSILSHELRAPVTTIYAGAQFLMARGAELAQSDRTELAQDIAAESERLSRMMDDLVILARAERGVDLTCRNPTLVQRRLAGLTKSIEAEWPDRRFVFEVPEDAPAVTGDDGYLDQVLRNLIGNAAKYGRTTVTVRAEVRAGEVVVSVLDDGPGIPPADRERVFEMFARVKATSKLPGTGIGLYVARKLVTAMGGRLSVANRSEGGAEFTLALPVFVEEPSAV